MFSIDATTTFDQVSQDNCNRSTVIVTSLVAFWKNFNEESTASWRGSVPLVFLSDVNSLFNFQSRDKKYKLFVCKIVDRVFTGPKTFKQKSNIKIFWLSTKSRFSKYKASNAIIHGSNF